MQCSDNYPHHTHTHRAWSTTRTAPPQTHRTTSSSSSLRVWVQCSDHFLLLCSPHSTRTRAGPDRQQERHRHRRSGQPHLPRPCWCGCGAMGTYAYLRTQQIRNAQKQEQASAERVDRERACCCGRGCVGGGYDRGRGGRRGSRGAFLCARVCVLVFCVVNQ
mgnify:CR=1 FL=1